MEYWRLCSSCKKQIPLSTKYYECSVSTCSGKRTGYVFCSLHCFERHLPGARHRDAGAIECLSPSTIAVEETGPTHSTTVGSSSTPAPTRRIIASTPSTSQNSTSSALSEDEILIVVSKLKNYIRDKSEMNTSGDVAEVLSHFVRRCCDNAILRARQDGRKTVMARDFID